MTVQLEFLRHATSWVVPVKRQRPTATFSSGCMAASPADASQHYAHAGSTAGRSLRCIERDYPYRHPGRHQRRRCAGDKTLNALVHLNNCANHHSLHDMIKWCDLLRMSTSRAATSRLQAVRCVVRCCTPTDIVRLQEVTSGAASGRRRRLQVTAATGVQVPVSIETTADQAGLVGTALQSAVSAGTLPQQLQQRGACLDWFCGHYPQASQFDIQAHAYHSCYSSSTTCSTPVCCKMTRVEPVISLLL